MQVLNIFIRESVPLAPKGKKATPQSQTSTEPKKYYYSASLVIDAEKKDFKKLGIFTPMGKTKSILEELVAKELYIPGESKAGEYMMVSVEIEEKDFTTVAGMNYLKAIRKSLLDEQ